MKISTPPSTIDGGGYPASPGTYTVVYWHYDVIHGQRAAVAAFIRPSEQGYIQLPTDRAVWAHILATEYDGDPSDYEVLYVIPGAHNFLQFDD